MRRAPADYWVAHHVAATAMAFTITTCCYKAYACGAPMQYTVTPRSR